ncbi:MAG: DUF5916 domain-containing protein [Rhodothermales bacterium]
MKKLLFFIILCASLQDSISFAQSREVSLASDEGVMAASFLEGAIALDGILDETSWQQAVAISDFRQHEPVDGLPATQKTEVRVLYGSNSLYVGAILHDEDPSAIESTLGRRDDYNRADWFLVSLDAYFDKRTAYTFGVNAAGVQFDAIQSGSSNGPSRGGGGSNAPRGMDPSWDAIWYANVQRTGEGWAVEMRIPYSMLRFSDAAIQTWGIHFTRRNPRLGEQTEWPHVPRTERDNLIARFGKLEGIKNVKPRRNIQISPYTVAGLYTKENEDIVGQRASSRTFDVGGDLKMGLGPNITLDATINPDFGQVDADPAVLNLTAFEIFFEERRPFFVEGINIYEFSLGRGGLLYTRRIGADAPIIGATKISGRTGSGLSFGVLGAATGDRFNPTRGYAVARVSQQIGTYSKIGGIFTLFDGANGDDLHLQSLVAGADWDLRLLDNRYGIEGFLALSDRNWTDTAIETETGIAANLEVRKRQGDWDGFAGIDIFGDTFNPNEAGQLGQNNYVSLKARVGHEINGGQPFGPFLRAGARLFTTQQFSYDKGLDLGQRIDFGSRWTLKGFQSLGVDFEVDGPFGGYDIYETRGLLPWAKPTRAGGEVDFETDERRNWQLEPGIGWTFFDDGGKEYELSLEGKWNAGEKLSLTGEVTGAWENNVTAWSANESFRRSGSDWLIGLESNSPDEQLVTDFAAFEGAEGLDDIFQNVVPLAPDLYYASIFGHRDTRSIDFTLRSSVTLTPTLSIQLYGQLFAARGQYGEFQIHQSRDDLVDFSGYPKRDEFSFSSLQSNVVLRWEYRPGSSLFMVWSHGRRAEDELNPLAPWSGSPYDRSFNDQFSNTFDIFPENVFLIKLNYTFLY